MHVKKSEFIIAQLLAKLDGKENEPFKIKKQPEKELDHSFLSFEEVWIGCAKKTEGFLGKGEFGKVKKCIDKEGNVFAVKISTYEPPEPNETDETDKIKSWLAFKARQTNEWSVLKELNYFKYGFFIKEKAYTVMTYFKGIDLFDFTLANLKLKEEKVFRLALKAAWAVYQLHGIGIIHGDIKEENFIVDEESESLRLIDFAGSHRPGEAITEKIETDGYGAPEQNLSFASDIFSLGRVFEEFQRKYGVDFSTLISEMMDPLPEKRPNIADVIVKLQAMQDNHKAKKWLKIGLMGGGLVFFALGFVKFSAIYLAGCALNIAVGIVKNHMKARAFESVKMKSSPNESTLEEKEAFKTGYCVSRSNQYSKSLLTWFHLKNYSKAYYAGERWYELNPQDPGFEKPAVHKVIVN